MTRVDLITGFLGAGKTTFIHRYLAHLNRADQKIIIIENEFGSVGVDKTLLRDEDCQIEDLSGVCMCCTGRDKFIGMLIDAAAQGCDRVLVEPSGIYDVDEFFNVMEEKAVRECCEIGSVLTIVDAQGHGDLSGESRYLMVSQLLAAGEVILSKTQLCEPEAAVETVRWMNELVREQGGDRVFGEDVCVKDWDDLTDDDYRRFQTCGYARGKHAHMTMNHGEVYGAFMTADYCLNEDDLRARLNGILSDERYGRVSRAKGYVRDYDMNWYEVNCTRTELSVRPVENLRRGVLVVIGQGLDDEALKGALLPRPVRQ